LPDATALAESVRTRIRRERLRRLAAVAAAILLVAFLGYLALRPDPLARLYADAALDHRLEVTEHQPRHWRSDPSEIEKLAARFQLSNVAALAPAGYRLEHAKMCGIDGKPALHLVYSNGTQEVSLYVRARPGRSDALHTGKVGAEQLASFQNDRLEAVVASSRDCLPFAQFTQRALL
jgi:anti-sigma factor RsiW